MTSTSSPSLAKGSIEPCDSTAEFEFASRTPAVARPGLPPRMDLSDNCQRSSGCFQSCGCRATPGSLAWTQQQKFVRVRFEHPAPSRYMLLVMCCLSQDYGSSTYFKSLSVSTCWALQENYGQYPPRTEPANAGNLPASTFGWLPSIVAARRAENRHF